MSLWEKPEDWLIPSKCWERSEFHTQLSYHSRVKLRVFSNEQKDGEFTVSETTITWKYVLLEERNVA